MTKGYFVGEYFPTELPFVFLYQLQSETVLCYSCVKYKIYFGGSKMADRTKNI